MVLTLDSLEAQIQSPSSGDGFEFASSCSRGIDEEIRQSQERVYLMQVPMV